MKKLFNYALMAAALLVGVNVNAQTYVAEVAGVQYETLDDAFSAALTAAVGGEEITIKSIAPASVPMAAITIQNGEKLVWNVNGQTISMDASNTAFGIKLLKGYLKITNGEAATPGNITFYGVYGDGGKDYDAGTVKNYQFLQVKGANPSDSHDSQGDYYNNYYTKFVLDKNVNISCIHNAYGIAITHNAKQSDKKYYAIGVAVEIAGHVDATWGAMSTNGNLSKVDEAQAAHIHIMNGAELIGTTNDAAGIYAGGFAYWDIDGATIIGATGLYAKAGVFTLTDTKVTGNGAAVTPTAYGNGFESTGDGIVLDSHGSYAGGISVTVNGNTEINSENGYGVQEVLTQGTEDKCEKINIVSGSISGEQGSLVTTETGKNNTVIEGGTFNSDITEYLGDDNIITPVEKDGKIEYVIATKDPDKDWKNDITTAEEGDYVKVSTEEDQTLTKDITAEYLVQEGTATITVPEDVTLTVGEIVMSKDSRIIVEPGAKLIVEGDKGIVANNMENIVIETSSEKAGVLLLDPQVTSNKTPKATVRFYSKAFGKSEMVQLFGCPMVQVDKVEISNTDYKAQFDVWRKNAWDRIGVLNGSGLDYSKFDLPFGLYCITSNNPSDKLLYYDFTGSILGNSQPASLNLGNGYISIANSWTGMMDTEAIIKKLIAIAKEHSDLQASIYMYTQTGTTLTWEGKSLADLGEEDIKPMEAIMILNEGNGFNSDLLSYKDLVFDPATKTNVPGAPAAKVWDKASIRIAAENQVSDRAVIVEADQFSSDFENGYDTKKYMNEEVCVYVNADNQYDIYATDDVNNTFVGFNCKNAGKYTMSFEGVTGNFALVDTKTNARIEMSEGNTYEFLAEAGEDAYRFQIVEAAKAPTNNEKVNAAVKATKALINDQIVINNGERFFNMLGTDIK